MKPTISLSVSSPCAEKWSTFTPTNTGGFCASCSKNVVDFTTMSDEKIRAYFQSKPADTCGRFRQDQLRNYTATKLPSFTPAVMIKAGFVSLLLALITKPASSQQITAKARTEVVQNFKTEDAPKATGQSISGIVRDETNAPLPGVSVYVKGKTQQEGTVTDADGKFQYPVALNEGDILVFSFIGMKTQEYVVPFHKTASVEISMAYDMEVLGVQVIMGKVAYDEPYQEKTSRVARWWRKAKAIF